VGFYEVKCRFVIVLSEIQCNIIFLNELECLGLSVCMFESALYAYHPIYMSTLHNLKFKTTN